MTYRPKRPEDAIHEYAVSQLRAAFKLRGYKKGQWPFFHCPNEGARTKAHTSKLYRLGFSAGVSDLIIVYPTAQGNPGAALELKATPGEGPRPKQRVWLEHFERIGFAIACTGGHEETANKLVEWGYLHEAVIEPWLAWAMR